MPGKKICEELEKKEQKMDEYIKESGKKRYGKRAEKVAARTVMKHHKKKVMTRESN